MANDYDDLLGRPSRRDMTNYLEHILLTDGRTRFLSDEEMMQAANACQHCGKQLAAENPNNYCDIECKRLGKRKVVRMSHDAQHTKHPGIFRPSCEGC